jgi:hypothetical protein
MRYFTISCLVSLAIDAVLGEFVLTDFAPISPSLSPSYDVIVIEKHSDLLIEIQIIDIDRWVDGFNVAFQRVGSQDL